MGLNLCQRPLKGRLIAGAMKVVFEILEEIPINARLRDDLLRPFR